MRKILDFGGGRGLVYSVTSRFARKANLPHYKEKGGARFLGRSFGPLGGLAYFVTDW